MTANPAPLPSGVDMRIWTLLLGSLRRLQNITVMPYSLLKAIPLKQNPPKAKIQSISSMSWALPIPICTAGGRGKRPKPGFHTNRQTKQLIVNRQIASIREGRYIERDSDAINEHLSYERKDNGSYGAKDGHHDDILMTRRIALSVAWDLRNSRSGNIDYAG